MQTLAVARSAVRLMDFLERTYETFGAKLHHYLLGILRSGADAEDALQTVFVKLAQRDKGDDIEDLTSYLFSAARHEAIRIRDKRRNARKRETESAKDDAEPAPPDLLAATEDREVDRKKLEAALATLPEEQREVVLLKVWEGLTFREIASVLGLPQDTAASRYRYALEKLKLELGD